MEIAVVGATAVVALDGSTVTDARVAITALAPTIRRVPDAEAALAGATAGEAAVARRRRGRRGGLRSDLRRARLGALPRGDGRGDHAARDRRRAHPGARRRRPGSRQRERRVKVAATLSVNGIAYPVELDPGTSLLAAVRDAVGLTGSKEGCDDSECGACMMLLDGKPVNSCSYLALQAEGSEVTTVEGLAAGGELSPLQAAFLEHGGVQCGFCTPGHADLRDGAPRPRPRRRPPTRCGSRCPATSAAAPATTGSSRRCSTSPVRPDPPDARRSGRSRRRERALDALDDLRPRQAAQRDRRPPAQHVLGGRRPLVA